MQEILNTEEVKIWKMFLRAHAALMRTMESDIQRAHGISISWYDVLTQLSLADSKKMTHSQLGERMLVTGGGISRLVDRMAKAGLVVRRASRQDRRSTYVVLTKKGEETLELASPQVLESVQDGFLRHLLEDEMPPIRGLLERVLADDVPGGAD